MGTGSARSIAAALAKFYTTVTIEKIHTLQQLELAVAAAPDLVFLGMKSVPSSTGGEPVWVSDHLQAVGIPHTGSLRASHDLEHSKHLAKQRVLEYGLATAPFWVVKQNDARVDHTALSFPLFVKPTNKGGGQGIDKFSIVRTFDELYAKVASIREVYSTDALVEEYLDGREFSVAIIRTPGSEELLAMPIELIANKDSNGERMLSSFIKDSNSEGVLTVDHPDEHLKLVQLATGVFRALGGRDYGRIDIRFDSLGIPHFLEANLTPSLTEDYGSFPKAYMLNEGVDYETMIMNIVQLATHRAVA